LASLYTFGHETLCHIAKQSVITRLKCPPDVLAKQMIPRAIPKTYVSPMVKRDPTVEIPFSREKASIVAVPGYTSIR
jgi:hypothetical protein